jgi:hypothetical protein
VAVRLQGSWVRILLTAWMLCLVFVVQVAASATGLSLVQGNPAGYVCVCVFLTVFVLETSTVRPSVPELVCGAKKEK